MDTKEIDSRAITAHEQANSLVIVKEADYLQAGQMAQALREIEKEVANTFDPLIKEAVKHHKSLLAEKRRHGEPVERARKLLKAKMIEWQIAEDARRAAQEADLRARVQREAENARIAESEALERAGKGEQAEALLEQPIQAPNVVLPPPPKAKGQVNAVRTIWRFRVVDPAKVPDQFKMVDEKKIGALVRAGNGTWACDGIEVYSEKV